MFPPLIRKLQSWLALCNQHMTTLSGKVSSVCKKITKICSSIHRLNQSGSVPHSPAQSFCRRPVSIIFLIINKSIHPLRRDIIVLLVMISAVSLILEVSAPDVVDRGNNRENGNVYFQDLISMIRRGSMLNYGSNRWIRVWC